MAKKAKAASGVPRALSEEALEEIEERRRAVAAETAARENERTTAWKEHARDKEEVEERRRATEPPKEFAEAARAARERFEKERVEHWRSAWQAEAKKRNPDEELEARFLEEHADIAERHLGVFARFQDTMTGGDENTKRAAGAELAASWKEKESLLLALATKKKRGAAKVDARLQAKSDSPPAVKAPPAKKTPAKKK